MFAGRVKEAVNVFLESEYFSVVCANSLENTVTIEEAYAAGKALVREEGVLAGITSGAAVHAAAVLARREENRGKVIVALLPDAGDQYLSTGMFG